MQGHPLSLLNAANVGDDLHCLLKTLAYTSDEIDLTHGRFPIDVTREKNH
jgi:hypothetical protein